MRRRPATYQLCCALIVSLCTWTVQAHASEPFGVAAWVPSPAQTAAAALPLQTAADPRAGASEPTDASLFESPWFWAGVAGVVVASVAVGLVLANSGDEPEVPKGTLNLSVSVLTQAPCTQASESQP